jgi:hypothetical protein
MHPDAAELFRPPPGIHLPIEVIGHRLVIKDHRGTGTDLANKLDLVNVKQILGGGDPESADLRVASVTQV